MTELKNLNIHQLQKLSKSRYYLVLQMNYLAFIFTNWQNSFSYLIAVLARTLASALISPKFIIALTSCRLISLHKNQGVIPREVGEVFRWIMGKAVGWILKDDIQELAGPLQSRNWFETWSRGYNLYSITHFRRFFNWCINFNWYQ